LRGTKFGGGGKALLRLSASDGQARAGKNSFPQPPSFLPARAEIFFKIQRSDFRGKKFGFRSAFGTKKTNHLAMIGFFDTANAGVTLPVKPLKSRLVDKSRLPQSLDDRAAEGRREEGGRIVHLLFFCNGADFDALSEHALERVFNRLTVLFFVDRLHI